jgi:4-hydroxy-3-polyprenylbenzoate decarboxylase
MLVRRFVVGVTGASGSMCARAVIRGLLDHPEVARVHVILSRYSLLTINTELGTSARDEAQALRTLIEHPRGRSSAKRRPWARSARKLVLHKSGDMAAAISSGSYPVDGMVVVPCSGGSLAAIATGVSTNLIHRAAEVTLKERRPLILAFRETPLNLVHIENMRRASLAGSIIFPLTPAFYNHPRDLEEIVANFTGRIFDLLRLPHTLVKRWGGGR